MSAEFKSTTAETEPTSAATPLPIWLLTGMLLLVWWGAVYFDQHGGWFEAKVFHPYASMEEVARYQPAKGPGPDRENGRVQFEKNCSVCHGSDGAGKPGQFPPLAGSEWVAAEKVNRLIHIPLLGINGPITVKGQLWNTGAAMPNLGGSLNDQDLADLLTYVRSSWGNKAAPVTEEQVAKVRKELAGRASALTEAELKKIAE